MWIRLGDKDRERYGGPEWVEWDQETYLDLPASELVELEKAMSMSFAELLIQRSRMTSTAMKATLWLARRKAGVVESFEDFDPAPGRARIRDTPELEGEQGSPPGSPSADSSPDEVSETL